MKKILAAMAVSLVVTHAFAEDLFSDGNLREMKSGYLVQPTETVGGYPFFQNDGNWRFLGGRAYASTGGSDPIKMGSVQLDYLLAGYVLARQNVAVNTGTGTNSSWGGSPCSPEHLVIRNKGQGKQDNCMTIDPQVINIGTTPATFLNIVMTNSGSSGRYYRIMLGINADLLGIRNSGLGDWTVEELRAKPYKKEAMDRLTAWAEKIQDASIKAFDFTKPQDVYANLPSLMTLLPVPEDLVGQKRSIAFVSAVEYLRHIDGFKSIAYTRYEDHKGAWGYVVNQPSQEAADIAAVAKCESIRTTSRPDTPKCEVYRITDGKRVSDTFDFKQINQKTTALAIAPAKTE